LAALPEDDKESTAIGTLGGQFRVDESGAATYTVPIDLLSGIAGVTPQLALSYSSAGDNGVIGIGWNIGGLRALVVADQHLKMTKCCIPYHAHKYRFVLLRWSKISAR
jgi:hypothetical protein